MSGHSGDGEQSREERERWEASRNELDQLHNRLSKRTDALANANREVARLTDALDKSNAAHLEDSFAKQQRINELTAEVNRLERVASAWGLRCSVLADSLAAGLYRIKHGEIQLGIDRLTAALARSREAAPPVSELPHDTGIVPVAGRGLREGVVSIQADARGVTIRVDDEQNPEFWLELVLRAGRLAELLAAVYTSAVPDGGGGSGSPAGDQINGLRMSADARSNPRLSDG